MNYTKYSIAILVILGALGILWKTSTFTPRQVGPVDEANAVRSVVTKFGGQLKKVSLLAPEAERNAEIDANYKEYLSPTLLEAWKKDPSVALGRTTSSPFPDHIKVASVSPRSLSSYTVEGNIIEAANGGTGTTTAAIQPVTFILEEFGNEWRIHEVSKGSYSALPREITVTGKYTCLPHKNTEGPQTLECALGIQANTGEYYAIDTGSYAGKELDNAPTGKTFTITGIFTPLEMLSSDHLKNYNVRGVLTAKEVKAE